MTRDQAYTKLREALQGCVKVLEDELERRECSNLPNYIAEVHRPLNKARAILAATEDMSGHQPRRMVSQIPLGIRIKVFNDCAIRETRQPSVGRTIWKESCRCSIPCDFAMANYMSDGFSNGSIANILHWLQHGVTD